MTYDIQDGQLTSIVALAAKNKAIARPNTPAANQATLNISTFPPSAGTITLPETLAEPTIPITQTGAPFAGLEAGGSARALITVNWT